MKKFLIKGILVDPQSNEAVKNEKVFRIEPKAMDLLVFLATNAGRTVTKDEILREVWADTVVSDDSITRCISQLRKVFDDSSQSPEVIETIPKKGYRIKPAVTFIDAEVQGIYQYRRLARKRNLLWQLAAGFITGIIAYAAVYGSGIRWSLGFAIILASFFVAFLLTKLIFHMFRSA
jgi:DNA-binding winged helix-turn-helix (wHTH) protein